MWVYGRFKNYNLKVDRAWSARIIDEKNNYINVIPETACEFVGEKDSYNKKLYKNDVVEFDGQCGTIRWSRNYKKYMVRGENDYLYEFSDIKNIKMLYNLHDIKNTK